MTYQHASCSVSRSIEEAASLAAMEIAACASESIASLGRFRFLATGGKSARLVYRELVRQEACWKFWHVYLTDERCVPRNSQIRNDRMIRTEWLDHVSIPSMQMYPIAGEMGALVGARRYAQVIESMEPFDMVLLGLGEDGHIASLFPGFDLGTELAVPVFNAPKLPRERISVSPRALCNAKRVVVVAGGKAKRGAVADLGHSEAFFWKIIGPSPRVAFYFDSDAMPFGA